MSRTEQSATRDLIRDKRLVLFDGGKIICALGVVLFHAHVDRGDLWYSGMFVFLFFIGYAPGARRVETLGERVARRARRILVPWLVWSAFYFLVSLARGRALPLGLPETWSSLLIGPTIHLWFLPFAFLGGIICETIQSRDAGRASPAAVGVATALAGLACLVWRPMAGDLPPFGQWQVSIPIVATGLGLAMVGRRRLGKGLILGPMLVVCILAIATGRSDGAVQTLIAGAFCVAAIEVELPEIPWLRLLGDHAFGVYLIHPFMMLVLAKAAPGIHDSPYALGLAAFAGALALTAILRLYPPTRRLT